MAFLSLKYNYVSYAYYGEVKDEEPNGYGVLYYSDSDDDDGGWKSDSSCKFAKFINKDVFEKTPILYYKSHSIPYFEDIKIYLGTVSDDFLINFFKPKSGIEVIIKIEKTEAFFEFSYYKEGNKLSINELSNGESILKLDDENQLLINKKNEKILSIYTYNNESKDGFGYECQYYPKRIDLNAFLIKDGTKMDVKYELPWTFLND